MAQVLRSGDGGGLKAFIGFTTCQRFLFHLLKSIGGVSFSFYLALITCGV